MDKKGWAGSVLAGLGLMYLLDPERGKRRRALLGDKLLRSADAAGDALGTTGRDLRNRTRGVFAEARSLVSRSRVSDEVLVERVRSKLGRVVTHPSSIEVDARDGRVKLSGPVLAREVEELLSCVSSVRGVDEVENRLEVHKQAGDTPGLQGGGRPPERRFELMQENWSPTARLFAGAAGGGLAAWGAKRRGAAGSALAIFGLGLLARAASNLKLERLLGLGSARRGIDVRKTIHIDAPVERVFDYWADVSNFPLFLSHVKEVRDHGQGGSHWEVVGPAGIPVEWDAVITALVPNQLLAWKTVPGEAVRHAGVVRFDQDPAGGTRIDVRMTYKPPAGVLGHAIAALFGADPKQALDDDLLRFKSLIETGKTTAHGEEVVAVDVVEVAELIVDSDEDEETLVSGPEEAPAGSGRSGRSKRRGSSSPRPGSTPSGRRRVET